MKNKYNTLQKYIFDHSDTEYRKETIEGLFRPILEPIVSNQKIDACILLKMNDVSILSSYLKRLEYTSSKIYSFTDVFGQNIEKEDLWGSLEFIVVLSQRYSVCLIWDYSSASVNESSRICLLFNSKIIADISKIISENSKIDFKEILNKYAPDRRENLTLNSAVNNLVSMLNDSNQELLFSESEKKQILISDDTAQTAKIVADKAKYIAHEIKNNLSIINLYSKIIEKKFEKIQSDEESTSSISNALKSITNASESVSSLINDLRCLSSPYITEISLKHLITETVSLCEQKAIQNGIKIQICEFVDKNINTDKIKLRCVLTNVIYNAIEACNSGCEVKISVKYDDKNASIYIENNGEPIPENIRLKIFDSDFTTKKTGNGLGLAICKSQMQMLNGNIELVCSSAQSTVFKITV